MAQQTGKSHLDFDREDSVELFALGMPPMIWLATCKRHNLKATGSVWKKEDVAASTRKPLR